eukprot:TRINITY_DN25012_c0_g1_i1.p1 TRINITY_DN25012_c0_g1~~TRINITY_DN25012_c0_g1_i1.p1  ORF type:complete len:355 (+),score=40.43 TRINITY_DN25012_c0_g1_i1:89-1066(+)
MALPLRRICGRRCGQAVSSRFFAAGPGRGRKSEQGEAPVLNVEEQISQHTKNLEARSRQLVGQSTQDIDKFQLSFSRQRLGTPYRFRIDPPSPRAPKDQEGKGQGKGKQDDKSKTAPRPYSDFAGLRFPTLDTAENFDYHKDRGLTRLIERSYPIKVPAYRRLDPYLREYIFFLHNLDPARFTISKISQRYRLREKTVAKVVQEFGANRYLTRTGLTRLSSKRITREESILSAKEQNYAKWVGWDQLGDEDDPESDDEALGEYKGWRSTSDWVRRQTVEVEMMSAFPMMEKRDPMPKRVDVDMVIDSRKNHKIINWLDPSDKVVF